MKTAPKWLVAIVALSFGAVALLGTKRPVPIPNIYESHEANLRHAERRDIDDLYARADWKAAKPLYEEFVEENKSSKNPEVQDEVASARMRIGYIAAKKDDFVEARQVFLEADKEYKGTEVESSDYGSLDDQAAYQAIVCLENTGDKPGAEKEYARFIAERKLSPLVHACWKRLKKLNGGKAKPEHDALLQAAVTASEQHGRLESAMCGPKAIVEVVKRTQGRELDYKAVAKACKADKDGTTMANLMVALDTYGFACEALELNANDFRKLAIPAIWLKDNHYVAIVDRIGNDIRVYDSLDNSRSLVKLPPLENADFRANVIVLKLRNQ